MTGSLPAVPFVPAPVFYLALLSFALLGYWIYQDAASRGSEYAWQWGSGTFVLLLLGVLPGIVALSLYFIRRRDAEATV